MASLVNVCLVYLCVITGIYVTFCSTFSDWQKGFRRELDLTSEPNLEWIHLSKKNNGNTQMHNLESHSFDNSAIIFYMEQLSLQVMTVMLQVVDWWVFVMTWNASFTITSCLVALADILVLLERVSLL